MREKPEAAFGFEKLDVYQRSIEFVAVAARIISELPSGYSSLSDQLRRAALSVPVNVAEAT
jgi:four helix bundle protein